jgi:iron complex transport system ATP-binding protein
MTHLDTPPPGAAELLRLDRVRFAYPDAAWALRVEAFALQPGTCTGVVGPNGSGKSTLLKLAAGVLTPDAGDVRIDGVPLASLRRREIALRLGYLPQEAPALYDFTVGEVAAMGRYAHQGGGLGLATARDAEAVADALRAVALDGLVDRPLSHLSGGERRRALIASVLAQEPRAVLLDEPTAGLDPHHAAALFRLLHRLSTTGLGVLIVTHDLNLASLFCHRLVMVDRGAVACEGSPREVLTPEALRALYGDELLVRDHPQCADRPVVLPAAGPGAGGARGGA